MSIGPPAMSRNIYMHSSDHLVPLWRTCAGVDTARRSRQSTQRRRRRWLQLACRCFWRRWTAMHTNRWRFGSRSRASRPSSCGWSICVGLGEIMCTEPYAAHNETDETFPCAQPPHGSDWVLGWVAAAVGSGRIRRARCGRTTARGVPRYTMPLILHAHARPPCTLGKGGGQHHQIDHHGAGRDRWIPDRAGKKHGSLQLHSASHTPQL